MFVTSESYLAGSTGSQLSDAISAEQHIILPDALFEGISGVKNSQGVLMVVEIPKPAPWPTDKSETVLLLEDIQDPGNLGSIIRSAAAAGVRHIALSEGSASAWSPKVVRAGMGAHFHVAIHETEDLLARVKMLELPVIATTPAASVGLFRSDLSKPVAWMFGNEGNGLSPGAMAAADMHLRVPMVEGSESLNVAATVAVCLFEQFRQRAEIA